MYPLGMTWLVEWHLYVLFMQIITVSQFYSYSQITLKKKDLYRIYSYFEVKKDTNFIFSEWDNFIIRPIIFYYKKYNLICCLIKLWAKF